MSSDDKSPLERALELFVFAPLGMAITAREALPELIEKGRRQATNQITVAKMMGEFAVKQGREDAGRAAGQLREQAEGVLAALGLTPDGSGGGASAAAAPPAPAPPSAGAAPSGEAATGPARPTPGPGAADLAIPDYDSLSASQVVPRLAGLSPEELEAVRGYEAAHRGRKTILNRVAQLQAS